MLLSLHALYTYTYIVIITSFGEVRWADNANKYLIYSFPPKNVNTIFYFKCHLITFKIHNISFKVSSAANCFGLTRPSSGNYQLEDITLHGLARRYYLAVTAHRRI
jgi:hypothetical protein